jgi:hypothetical protein
MRMIALVSLVALGLTVAAPAEARNWVRIRDGWFDRDSVRRAGDLVYFDTAGVIDTEAGAPPAILPDQPRADDLDFNGDPGPPRAYNCRTRVLSIVNENGRIEAMFNQQLSHDEAAVFARLLCRRSR